MSEREEILQNKQTKNKAKLFFVKTVYVNGAQETTKRPPSDKIELLK